MCSLNVGWYGLPGQIKNYECDGETFIIDTKDKYAPFLQELSFIRTLRMLSPAQFQDGLATDPFEANSCHVGWTDPEYYDPIPGVDGGPDVVCAGIKAPMGTGPLKLASDITGDYNEVRFEAFAAHWDGPIDINSVTVKKYADSDAVKAALLDGSLDVVCCKC